MTDTKAKRRDLFKKWWRVLPTAWQAGIWAVLNGEGVFRGQLPSNSGRGKELSVFFMTPDLADKVEKFLESL